jgi:hypothetical protein
MRNAMEQRVIIHRVGDFTASQVFFTASQVFYERLGWRCATEEVVFFQLGVILLSLLPREAQAREADHPPEGSGFCGVALRLQHEQQAEFEAVVAEAQSAGARIIKTIETRRRQMR